MKRMRFYSLLAATCLTVTPLSYALAQAQAQTVAHPAPADPATDTTAPPGPLVDVESEGLGAPTATPDSAQSSAQSPADHITEEIAQGKPDALDTSPEKTFNADSFMLDNGMMVVVIPNHRAPVVTHMVWYKVGALDEPRGLSGIAHFLEHLMFKGTDTIPPGEFSTRVKTLGGNDNAFTSQDYTAYYQSVAVEHLETVMTMEADRMRGLLLPPDHMESERKVVIEERRERTENNPRGYLFEQLRSLLFINHPYGNPVIGWLHEMDGLNREHAKAFYDSWYAPNNAVLVVSGAVTAAELKPLATRIYGVIPTRPVPERTWTTVPPLPGIAHLTYHHPSVRQPVLTRVYRVPSFIQNRDESLAFDVLQNAIDGGAATRLYRTLVVEEKVATSVSMSYSGLALSDATLSFSLVPAADISLETLEARLDEFLRALIRDGLQDQEIAEAKDRLIDEAAFARDSLAGPAMIFGQALTAGLEMDDIEYWPAYIRAVEKAQVEKVVRTYLDPDRFNMRPYVTGYLLPGSTDENSPQTTNAPESAEPSAAPASAPASSSPAGTTDTQAGESAE